eukprot:148085-Rhodomonas_salina.4
MGSQPEHAAGAARWRGGWPGPGGLAQSHHWHRTMAGPGPACTIQCHCTSSEPESGHGALTAALAPSLPQARALDNTDHHFEVA